MTEGTTYRDAGVDIEKADAIVARMREAIRGTWIEGTTEDFGDFAASFFPPFADYRRPRLVACTDSVGTKIKLAAATGRHREVGIDCVGMVVNDMVTEGARPLFLLDYIASGQLQPEPILEIVEGLADGCRQAGCALVGGETAEMPGVYGEGDHEIVGFALGIAEGDPELLPRAPRPKDQLIGLASDGLHSNGFSLVRRVIADRGWELDRIVSPLEVSLGEELMRPTRIYARAVLDLFERGGALAFAHITGGGIPGNVPRVLPAGTAASIDWSSWERPPVFDLIADAGNVPEEEMRRTFNLGVGMVAVVPPEGVDRALEVAREAGVRAIPIGEVTAKGDEDGG
ncbi:MAG: phosphoribosylformylglycinamidine cyclo-ligase [Bacillota bacterium]